MTVNPLSFKDDQFDAEADRVIAKCMTAEPPTSFFLFAGAGSGKTRSLVQALQVIKTTAGAKFRLNGRRVGVITFTKKACDEIKRRLEYDDLFAVSTIHSFSWSLIKGLDHDIREWLRSNLKTQIAELEEKERKGRSGTKASGDRINAIASKKERIECLDQIRRFVYNPEGDNPERNALNHAEVISITAAFLTEKPLMRSLLVNKFPILLIDESQDTNKELIEALYYVQTIPEGRFALGVIGDTMQRIYTAGKLDLDSNLPGDWARPAKRMNHRSCRRIIELINRIREPVDSQTQQPRTDKGEGFVRLFILPQDTADKSVRELEICKKMAEITGDDGWIKPNENVKTLILEHRMAANRLNFLAMWDALWRVERLQTGLKDGTLPGLRFFSHLILPLIKAYQSGNKFAVASIVRKESPLLEKTALKACGVNQRSEIERAREAVNSLTGLWREGNVPTFLQVLMTVRENNLFEIPEVLRPLAKVVEVTTEKLDADENSENDELVAWRSFLETSFDQIERYNLYIQGEAQFDTHQGIKGLEFPRVCVIMDDAEARGFTFSYDGLFGAKGDSTRRVPVPGPSFDHTRRLFYVTCSRAEDSLALVAYTSSQEMVRNHVLEHEWFKPMEIELMT